VLFKLFFDKEYPTNKTLNTANRILMKKNKSIICFKIKNPPHNYVGRKKEIPRKSLIFLGWLNLPPKFDIELLSLFTKYKIIIMYKKVLATISYFWSEIIK
jgi:hypothetical protein